MVNFYRFAARSDHPVARAMRSVHAALQNVELPAPRVLTRAALLAFLASQAAYHFSARVLVAEPLFKARCRQYGRNVRTGPMVHWIQGQGDIILGDNVLFDGKSSISFGSRFAERPTLRVGSNTIVGHGAAITVGKLVTIGSHCMIAGGAGIADSNGHPTDPERRLARQPPSDDEVRPVAIEDNVWIGRSALIMPGVTIGEGSVVAAHSVVSSSVPPRTLVAGNPARLVQKFSG
jgi:acetyltransferase-like isoleucine patch superfamily enzyme